MKNRFPIINSALAIAVLFSMLLQSLHSFEHLRQVISEKECHHQYTGQADVSHQHHPFDECFVCGFTFSAFITPQTISYSFHFTPEHLPYNNNTPTEAIFSFSGSSCSLRGPPSTIV